MNSKQYKLGYEGSIFWLIFWLIVFFPIAFVLLLTAVTFQSDQTVYTLRYDGSRFWLCFWVLVFFPVAFVLLIVNGFFATVTRPVEVSKPPPVVLPPEDEPKTR